MAHAELLKRITINTSIYGGNPFIRGLGCRESDILEMLANGLSNEQILNEFSYLELEDIYASLLFAALKLNHSTLHAA